MRGEESFERVEILQTKTSLKVAAISLEAAGIPQEAEGTSQEVVATEIM